ncbi:MAG TPA: glutamine amidotransferase [Chloroflexota bacterium]|nr:glutamine amidotransferase [Chloroflexota bacterium]
MAQPELRLVWLYPDSMSLYGDRGNVIALTKRAEWRGVKVTVVPVGHGERLEEAPDVVLFGGGQDREQRGLEEDFLALKGPRLRDAIEDDVPVLAVCGGFQMLAHGYRDADGTTIRGLGVLDATTEAPPRGAARCIGNVVVHTECAGDLVGFENHGGRTKLGSCAPFGRVLSGHGNNGRDGTEGARYRNCFGTYLHGSLLPKNPRFTDLLLALAVGRHEPGWQPAPLDDHIEQQAHDAALAQAR